MDSTGEAPPETGTFFQAVGIGCRGGGRGGEGRERFNELNYIVVYLP